MISDETPAKKPIVEIAVNASDLNIIKQYANTEYMQSTMPKELDGPEFLVLCYAKAVDRFLNSKGLGINIKYTARLPYEPES